MKRLRYYPHARKQMRKRGISIQQVEELILRPQINITQQNGRIRVMGTLRGGKHLTVIFEEEKNVIIVVTAY